tara:strand:+ start:1235 stop:1957 length:723 start_codon:yes stop_codon:yes gene_type:complete
MYSYLTRDRSGAQIQDMILCKAYCNNNNIEYLGCCYDEFKEVSSYTQNRNLKNTVKLCKFLNFEIPVLKKSSNVVCCQKKYINALITPEFQKNMREKMEQNLIKIKHDESDEFVVAVHIRRGDVTKDGRWFFRYTDNEYYTKIIKYIKDSKPNAKIYIFSERNSYESFDEFKNMGCILMLDTDLSEAWNYMIQADIFVMASSSFSIVPALFNTTGQILYTWNKYFKPLPTWILSVDKLSF